MNDQKIVAAIERLTAEVKALRSDMEKFKTEATVGGLVRAGVTVAAIRVKVDQ